MELPTPLFLALIGLYTFIALGGFIWLSFINGALCVAWVLGHILSLVTIIGRHEFKVLMLELKENFMGSQRQKDATEDLIEDFERRKAEKEKAKTKRV